MAGLFNYTNLPRRDKRGAIKTFKGGAKYVEAFLADFEELGEKHQLSLHQAGRAVVRYMNSDVREVVEEEPAYRAIISGDDVAYDHRHQAANNAVFGNLRWVKFKDHFECLYDAYGRYTLADLRKFVKERSKERISNLAKFKAYEREFIKIGGWLEWRGRISADESDICFWRGIDSQLRKKIRQQVPDLDESKPLTRLQIKNVVYAELKSEEDFDTSDSEDDDFDTSSNDSEDEDFETSSSDSEDEDSSSESSSSSEDEQAPAVRMQADEIMEILADRLGRLQLSDPEFRPTVTTMLLINLIIVIIVFEGIMCYIARLWNAVTGRNRETRFERDVGPRGEVADSEFEPYVWSLGARIISAE